MRGPVVNHIYVPHKILDETLDEICIGITTSNPDVIFLISCHHVIKANRFGYTLCIQSAYEYRAFTEKYITLKDATNLVLYKVSTKLRCLEWS